MNKKKRPRFPIRKFVFRLSNWRKPVEDDQPEAILEAFQYFREDEENWPEWLLDGIERALKENVVVGRRKAKGGRHANSKVRLREKMIQAHAWQLVDAALSEQPSKAKAIKQGGEMSLDYKDGHTPSRTMKSRYEAVERSMAKGEADSDYFVPRRDIARMAKIIEDDE
ncbi:hypothetical protein [Pacificispira sp.]|uniref:hypothetical protein n=1 Tax=Pacificispira sp. TaxID=2888761 RepID=UPI003B5179D2